MICLPYLHAIVRQKHRGWGSNCMLLKMKRNAVEDWCLTVISNILYDNEIRKRSKYAFFRSVLPLVANMRVFRRLVKIFRCLSVAARLSRRFPWSCLPSRSFCHGHACHRAAGAFTFARYLFPPNVVTCLPVPLALPLHVVPLAWVRMPLFQLAPPFILLKASGAVRKEE